MQKDCTVNKQKIVNDHTNDKLKDVFKTWIDYLDTSRDRQAVKGLIAHITSVSCASQLLGYKSRQGTSSNFSLISNSTMNLEKLHKCEKQHDSSPTTLDDTENH